MKKNLYRILLFSLLGIFLSCGEQVDPLSQNYYLKSGEICYTPGGNWFERGSVKTDADKNTFQVLSEDVGKDKSHIYYKGYKQPQVDYHSFSIAHGIFKDKNHVYHDNSYDIAYNSPHSHEWSIIPLADPQTYVKLTKPYYEFAKDKNRYFYNNEPLEVDYQSFKIINKRFSKDKNSVYIHDGNTCTPTKFTATTVDSLTDSYILLDNKTLLYYQNSLFDQHFDIIKNIRVLDNTVVCINDAVIVDGQPFRTKDADATSFEILFLSSTFFIAKDKNQVYYQEEIIKDADPATYQHMHLSIGKDKNHVYNGTEIIQVPDVATFRRTSKSDKNYDFEDNKGNKFDYIFRDGKVKLKNQSGDFL
ncbi:DKNYY domain-containing protein [Sphingobacterium sp. SRCM116780]|uniref:DKNYY domain-containing protein n=1 Tax=Sphingobacterium sp. SRCM116780 TaxID=2907623 RepID=UPI001F45102D|nr:DKNYY domain-containing protein [Sphingobacterium sp. SRCM116780]UIR55005.1 DKNYY domain-containing protein [Sphingobacterium sp. SRCM116780]